MNEGTNAYALAAQLYPIYRSITGKGVRKTLSIIKEYIKSADFNIIEIPSGTQAFDWTIPEEWEIEDAFIENEQGDRILSFDDNCLHVVGYSMDVDRWVELEELKKYIYTQEDQPDVIPYVTSYYEKKIGFCMSQTQKESLLPGKYHMVIRSSRFPGALSCGEIIFPGEKQEEILISTYSCHPSMANDNCSGLALSAELAKYVQRLSRRRYTYRFVFVPETIGAIAYISHKHNLQHLQKYAIGGFTLSCVGDDGDYSIVHSPSETALSDRVLLHVLQYLGKPYKVYSFLQRGSDERQFDSPGVGLSLVGFCRTKYWEFPEYHTSLDTMDFVSAEGFQGAFNVLKECIDIFECNKIYKASTPCEPQLGRRGLYPNTSQKGVYGQVEALTNLLAYADGNRDLLEISEKIHQPMKALIPFVKKLVQEQLLEEV